MPADDFTFIYRFRSPAGLRGQRCRRLMTEGKRYDRDGMVVINSGEEHVAVEFADGRREVVSRSGIVPAASKLGRMTIARIARGEKRPCQVKRKD